MEEYELMGSDGSLAIMHVMHSQCSKCAIWITMKRHVSSWYMDIVFHKWMINMAWNRPTSKGHATCKCDGESSLWEIACMLRYLAGYDPDTYE